MKQDTIDHASRAHARFSPSSLGYRELCPHWENQSDEGRDTTAADLGTKLHEHTEREDLTGLEGVERDIVELCLQYIAHVKKQHPGCTHLKEIRLPVLDQFGTADHIVLAGSEAHLLDTKYGFKEVDAADINAQMQAYALAVWDNYAQVDKLTVHILMPRLGKISRHTYTRKEDYERVKLRIITIIARAKNPDGFNPSLAACEWCGKKGTCTALAEKALMVVQRTGDLIDVPEHTGALTIKEPADMNKLMKIAPVLEKWAKDIKEEALRLHLEEGWEYEDFALSERSTPRAVTSVPLAWEALKAEMSVEEFLNCCKGVSIPELEEVFAAKAPRGKKAVEKERLECLLQDAMVLKEESTLRYLKIRKAPKKAEKKQKTIEV